MLIEPRVLGPERARLSRQRWSQAETCLSGLFSPWVSARIGDANLNRAVVGWLLDAEVKLVLPLWLGFRAVHAGIALVRRYCQSHWHRTTAPDKVPDGSKTDA